MQPKAEVSAEMATDDELEKKRWYGNDFKDDYSAFLPVIRQIHRGGFYS